MIPQRRWRKAEDANGRPVLERDFSANVIPIPKLRIIQLDGSFEKQYTWLPSLERSRAEEDWGLSVVQCYIANKFGGTPKVVTRALRDGYGEDYIPPRP